MPEKTASNVDIFSLMSEESPEEAKKKRRQELLEPTGVKEKFKEGNISVNKYTCSGVQCKLCVKACPTNALYWASGEIGIIEDLCVYCGACVLNCMVDDCIKIERKRENGEVERFSKPQDVIILSEKIREQKRLDRVKSVYPTVEDYCQKFPWSTNIPQYLLEKSFADKNTDNQKQCLRKPEDRKPDTNEENLNKATRKGDGI
jgi:ferredoxin